MKNLKLALTLSGIIIMLWVSISFCNVVAHSNPAEGTYEYSLLEFLRNDGRVKVIGPSLKNGMN